ncbi:unnamed protein product [Fraxinus pennsylvanica]|uniref:J domain-containing protein n=1 Tax=Fraxinus pennsylvanica TaxID=56036 RepID=A0AAD2AEX1_9LAMI|nr:unnamed protein product [Fraxinus pennsylvanica]
MFASGGKRKRARKEKGPVGVSKSPPPKQDKKEVEESGRVDIEEQNRVEGCYNQNLWTSLTEKQGKTYWSSFTCITITRKEESPQAEIDNSAKRINVNLPKSHLGRIRRRVKRTAVLIFISYVRMVRHLRPNISSGHIFMQSPRKMALVFHPDKNKSIGAAGASDILTKAYNVLSDNDKRSAYNLKLNFRVPQPPYPTDKSGFSNFTSISNSQDARNMATDTKHRHSQGPQLLPQVNITILHSGQRIPNMFSVLKKTQKNCHQFSVRCNSTLAKLSEKYHHCPEHPQSSEGFRNHLQFNVCSNSIPAKKSGNCPAHF